MYIYTFLYIYIKFQHAKFCFTEQSENVLWRGRRWRSSKPPVTKVKLGLNLEQHELSVIPEVDTSKSCNISFAGKVYIYGYKYIIDAAVHENYRLEELIFSEEYLRVLIMK